MPPRHQPVLLEISSLSLFMGELVSLPLVFSRPKAAWLRCWPKAQGIMPAPTLASMREKAAKEPAGREDRDEDRCEGSSTTGRQTRMVQTALYAPFIR